MIDFGEPRRVVPQPDGDALARQPEKLGPRVRVGFEDRDAVAEQAYRHAGSPAVRDRNRDGVLAQVPRRHIEPDRFGVDPLDDDVGDVVDRREVDLIRCGDRPGRTAQDDAGENGRA